MFAIENSCGWTISREVWHLACTSKLVKATINWHLNSMWNWYVSTPPTFKQKLYNRTYYIKYMSDLGTQMFMNYSNLSNPKLFTEQSPIYKLPKWYLQSTSTRITEVAFKKYNDHWH